MLKIGIAAKGKPFAEKFSSISGAEGYYLKKDVNDEESDTLGR